MFLSGAPTSAAPWISYQLCYHRSKAVSLAINRDCHRTPNWFFRRPVGLPSIDHVDDLMEDLWPAIVFAQKLEPGEECPDESNVNVTGNYYGNWTVDGRTTVSSQTAGRQQHYDGGNRCNC